MASGSKSARVLQPASGILEYEDIPDEDGDGIMDRGKYSGEGEDTAASRLGF